MHQCAIIVVVGHFQNCLNPNRYKQIYKFGRIEHLTFMIFIIFIYSLNIQNYEALFDVGRRAGHYSRPALKVLGQVSAIRALSL